MRLLIGTELRRPTAKISRIRLYAEIWMSHNSLVRHADFSFTWIGRSHIHCIWPRACDCGSHNLLERCN